MAISAKLKNNLVSLNAETIYYMSLSKNSLMGCEKIQKIKVISLLCYFKVNQKHQMQNSSFQLWDWRLVLYGRLVFDWPAKEYQTGNSG